jgi:uncharacterized protein YbjT (DUF2867 family)
MDRLSNARLSTSMITNSDAQEHPVLVLGGTGKTGRRVATRLTERGIPVRIGSRSGTPAFDWNDDSTWAATLDGARAAYVVYYPDLALPGAAETVGALAREAVERGVEHLVLLSGRGEEGARRGEQAVQAAGAAWTIVRASWFSQNFSEDHLVEPVRSGELALPAGDVAEPFVDVDDIADVVVAALTEPRHIGQVYEVTGPRLLTFADVAAEISAATGRTVRYVPVTSAEYAAAALAHGVPVDVVDALTMLFTEVLDGRNASLCDGIERALGRPPRDFGDYARATARTGVWAG